MVATLEVNHWLIFGLVLFVFPLNNYLVLVLTVSEKRTLYVCCGSIVTDPTGTVTIEMLCSASMLFVMMKELFVFFTQDVGHY